MKVICRDSSEEEKSTERQFVAKADSKPVMFALFKKNSSRGKSSCDEDEGMASKELGSVISLFTNDDESFEKKHGLH